MEINVRIAGHEAVRIIVGIVIVGLMIDRVDGLETFDRAVAFDQRAINAEVIVAGHAGVDRLLNDCVKERRRDFVLIHSWSVVRERGGIEHRLRWIQPAEPAE